jgi:hypothetical protein
MKAMAIDSTVKVVRARLRHNPLQTNGRNFK